MSCTSTSRKSGTIPKKVIKLLHGPTLSLSEILNIFSECLTEEHVWAIIYQATKTLEEIQQKLNEIHKIYIVDSTDEIYLTKDGRIHHNTFRDTIKHDGSSRRLASTVDKAIAEFGEVIYTALDYGLTDDDERQLTPGLENLLHVMASADDGNDESLENRPDTDDEGIEQDHGDIDTMSSDHTNTILNLCSNHLSVSKEADIHFRNVCRALVSEALELNSFMEKIKDQDQMHAKEIQQLALLDWTELWKETMYQLRQGVKLKKCSFTKTPIEYGLTPYEILMDDIRSRRYKLNKVMVDGDIPPKVKKDAHDIILDFIRSRPPLKPASSRQLKPKAKLDTTPVELLMISICNPDAKNCLRKTPRPPSPKIYIETSRTSIMLWNNTNKSQSEDIDGSSGEVKTSSTQAHSTIRNTNIICTAPSPTALTTPKHKKYSLPAKRTIIRPDPNYLKFDPDDEGGGDDVFTSPMTTPVKQNFTRRTTVGVMETPPSRKFEPIKRGTSDSDKFFGNIAQSISPITNMTDFKKTEILTPDTVTKDHRKGSSTSTPNAINGDIENKASKRKMDWALLNNLDLTLGEIVHIRSVHTKAEIDDLSVEPQKRTDLEKSKVCFLCMKNYFGIFMWAYSCKLCHQSVCSTCLTKIKIPTENWSNIPVFELEDPNGITPQTTPTPNRRSFTKANSSSKLSQQRRSMILSLSNDTTSLPTTTNITSETMVKLRRSNTVKYDRKNIPMAVNRNSLKVSDSCLVNVCLECKDVIHQILRAQRNARRQQLTRSLYLN